MSDNSDNWKLYCGKTGLVRGDSIHPTQNVAPILFDYKVKFLSSNYCTLGWGSSRSKLWTSSLQCPTTDKSYTTYQMENVSSILDRQIALGYKRGPCEEVESLRLFP